MQVSGNYETFLWVPQAQLWAMEYDGGAQIYLGGLCCTGPMTAPRSLPYEEQKLHFSHLYKETKQKTTNAM